MPDQPARSAESVRPHVGPKGKQYHHVGTGRTDSNYWCPECPGWFGVPHDLHPHGSYRKDCACVPCQKIDGRYPKHGVFMTHAEYRKMRLIDGRIAGDDDGKK